MANDIQINYTNDVKNSFLLMLRTVFSSDYLVEYKYNENPRTSKIMIQKAWTQQPEKKPALIINTDSGTTNFEHHNDEEVEEKKELSEEKIATNNIETGNDVVINIADTSGLVVGDAVIIEVGNIKEQSVITNVATNVSITVDRVENDYITPTVSKLVYLVKHYGGQLLNVVVTIYCLSDKDRNRISDFVAFSFRYLFRNKLGEYGIAYNKVSVGADGQEEIDGQVYYTKAISIPVYTEYHANIEILGNLINLISRINLEVDVYTEE